MELKIQIHVITVKDNDTGEEKTIKTVRTLREIVGYLEETEKEALSDAVYKLGGSY